jgi:hypothetical protein
MKRYILFGGEDYYPGGGWTDYVDAFETADEAHALGKARFKEYQWFHIADTHTGKIIEVVDPGERWWGETGWKYNETEKRMYVESEKD